MKKVNLITSVPIIFIIFTLLFTLHASRVFAAVSWTETSDTDFNDGVFNLMITSGTGSAAQLTLSPFGSAADGNVTISATKNINTDIISSGRVTYADGINYVVSGVWISSITCSAAPNGIIAGDEIILINQQGDSTNYGNVGNYEFFRIASVSGNFLIFTSSITKIYGATTSNNVLTGQKITAQRVPNWGNVTISGAAVSLTCTAWAGTKGGMVVFRATGTVSVGSGASVDVSQKGFRGGTPATDGSGTGFTGAEDRNGNVVTGGSDGGNATWTVGGDGGTASGSGGTGGKGGDEVGIGGEQGGSGNRGGGGAGSVGSNHHAGSGGGGCYDSGSNYSDGLKLTMGGGSAVGGGGGAGGGHGAGSNYPAGGKRDGYGALGTSNGSGDTGGNGGRGGAGNRGGGLVIVYVSTLTGPGSINSTGGAGGSGGGGGGSGHGGGGGGGGGGANGAAGGTIFIGRNFSSWSGTVNASGGTGGGGGGGGAGTDWDMQSRSAGGGGGAGTGGGGGGGAEGGSYSQSGHGGNAGSNGLKGVGATAENGGVAPGGGGTMYSNQVGGSANSGGYGAANGNNASGVNGGAGGMGPSMGGGGGGAGQGATGVSGYNSVTTGVSYSNLGTYKSDVVNTGIDNTKVYYSSWTPVSQPGGTNIAVGVRASNTSFASGDATPLWTPATNGGNPDVTGRYIQWMSTFTTTSSTTTPRIEDITINYTVKPWQEKTIVRTGKNAYGFGGGESFVWEVPAKSGQLVTITAYIRYNANYGAASKPKITLYNLGVNSNATMSASADTWEQLQVSGTPNRNGVLELKIEGFSNAPGAKVYVDDVIINQ